MTRREFEEIESVCDLIELCDEVGSDICSDIYDRDCMEEYEFNRIRDAINDHTISNLEELKYEIGWCDGNLPDSDYCIRDDRGEWYEVCDGDNIFEESKSLLKDFMEENELFDDEEEEFENENDAEFGVTDFSVQELIRVSVETVGGQ